MKKHKVAIWVEDGMIQGVRASLDIDVEVIDVDIGGQDRTGAELKWDAYQTELPFSIF